VKLEVITALKDSWKHRESYLALVSANVSPFLIDIIENSSNDEHLKLVLGASELLTALAGQSRGGFSGLRKGMGIVPVWEELPSLVLQKVYPYARSLDFGFEGRN
jgi:hypothetical protein